jgi:tRNA (guanine37-N1)-methyltransferase
MEAKAIEVDLKQAEKIRLFLIKHNYLRKDLKIFKKYDKIYFPIIDIENLPLKQDLYKITVTNFQKAQKLPSSYKDLISLPNNLNKELPTSYDIIGKIALIKLNENLLKNKHEIGKALFKANKNLETVCLVHPVEGELRTRTIEIIAGKKQTKTLHFEYGSKFIIDIKKAYFSPRLANERRRISKLVQKGETIVDMFAGVAPFSIIIGKFSNPKIIYAIDKNKEAVNLAKKNIKLNNLLDKIDVICLDAKMIGCTFVKKDIKADRIIMNLPFSAHLFFKNALKIAANNCQIHYYDILKEKEINNRKDNLVKVAKNNNFKLLNLKVNKIKTYAPREFYVGIDITAKKINIDEA